MNISNQTLITDHLYTDNHERADNSCKPVPIAVFEIFTERKYLGLRYPTMVRFIMARQVEGEGSDKVT